MIRRFLFSWQIFVLKSYPYFQILLVSFSCITLILYTTLCKPFMQHSMNRLEIFNEVSILISSYHLLAFTPFVDSPSLQYLLGWSLIGVITLNIVVNMLFIGYSTLCSLKVAFQRLLFRYCKNRETLRLNEDKVVALRPLPSNINQTEGFSETYLHFN